MPVTVYGHGDGDGDPAPSLRAAAANSPGTGSQINERPGGPAARPLRRNTDAD